MDYFGLSENRVIECMMVDGVSGQGGVVHIDGANLTVEDVVNVARNGYSVKIADNAMEKVLEAYKITCDIISSGKIVYGVTTGFGSLSKKTITSDEASTLSRNIVVSHAVAVGDPMPKSWVRAGMLIRLNALIKGHSGVSPATVNALAGLINCDITPVIPSKGSLACSGDLCLLSHMALVISEPLDDSDVADNPVLYKGKIVQGALAMKLAGVKKSVFGAKEGLAVVNGSTFTAGIACLAYEDASNLSKLGVGSLALTLEALLGVSDAFDSNIHELRNQEGQKEVARCIRMLTSGSKLLNSTPRIQDAYSLRCSPQVQGVLIDELTVLYEKLSNEINAVTDNPILVNTPSGHRFLSGGNFNGEIIGHFIDNLKTAVSELGAISERRQFRMIDGSLSNDLPDMLTNNPGLNSGYMITQYTSAALCLDNQHLANPSTTLSLPTCANQEDHNSNSYNAVRQVMELISNVQKILVFEYLCATRGISYRVEEKKGEEKDDKIVIDKPSPSLALGKISDSTGNSSAILGKWTRIAYERLRLCLDDRRIDHHLQPEMEAVSKTIFNSDFVKTIDDVIVQTDDNERLAIPRGTRDYHPEQMVVRKEAINKIENIFIRHGAVTIDTPVFELRSTLFGKYGDSNKLVFDLNDQGGSLCSLRYDLTVPFARYLAMHNKSHMKRYHMAKVYRRDNPVMARGRYREFMQCDLDIAGDYDLMVPDAEVLTIVSEILDGFNLNYTIKFNHKGLLYLLLDLCSVPKDKYLTTCSSIDKLDKMPWDYVEKELYSKGLGVECVAKICDMCKFNGEPLVILAKLRKVYVDSLEINKVLDEIELLFSYLKPLNRLQKLTFDTSLCRGLDYYTGIIFEAIVLDGTVSVGSIAAGGRYDELVGMFAKGRKIPAVGGSIGIERIFTILEARNSNTQGITNTKCYVTFIKDRKDEQKNIKHFNHVLTITSELWANNIPTEMVNDRNNIMKNQIADTLKSGIPYMIIVAENELAKGEVNIKDLANNKQESVPISKITEYLQNKLK